MTFKRHTPPSLSLLLDRSQRPISSCKKERTKHRGDEHPPTVHISREAFTHPCFLSQCRSNLLPTHLISGARLLVFVLGGSLGALLRKLLPLLQGGGLSGDFLLPLLFLFLLPSFLGAFGITGRFLACSVAAGRCFVTHRYSVGKIGAILAPSKTIEQPYAL